MFLQFELSLAYQYLLVCSIHQKQCDYTTMISQYQYFSHLLSSFRILGTIKNPFSNIDSLIQRVSLGQALIQDYPLPHFNYQLIFRCKTSRADLYIDKVNVFWYTSVNRVVREKAAATNK